MVTSLSLDARRTEVARPASRGLHLLVGVLVLVLAALAFLTLRLLEQTRALEARLAALSVRADQTALAARKAMDQAAAAEVASRAAAEGRLLAEAQTAGARQEADTARQAAEAARADAAQAQAEAEEIRRKAQAEVGRLEAALGEIAETHRTALGLVMNLGGDHLKFDFDKAELRPQDRELLSRIAGILMTSRDYTVSVRGHTDDVGSDVYNQKLSERRAQVVRDYLVESGMSPDILSVEGHGKSLPRVPGHSEEARAKNRRVELAIVNVRIRFGL